MFFLRDKLLGGLYAGVLFLVEVVEALDDAVVATSFEPYLGGVDDVLEDGVGGQRHGCDGIKILKRQPHGQDDIFLRQRLSARDAAVEAGTDGLAEDEVGGADGDPGEGKEDFELVVLFAGLEELFKGAAHKDDEHPRPQVVGQNAPAQQHGVDLGGGVLDEPSGQQGEKHGGPHAHEHVGHGFEEGRVDLPRGDERQDQRREHDDGEVAQEGVGREEGHAAAEHTGDDGRRRGRGREGGHAYALRDGRMPRERQRVEAKAHDDLKAHQDEVQRMEPQVARRDVAEGQQEHGGEQPRRKPREL